MRERGASLTQRDVGSDQQGVLVTQGGEHSKTLSPDTVRNEERGKRDRG